MYVKNQCWSPPSTGTLPSLLLFKYGGDTATARSSIEGVLFE